jgi:DNA polymerase-3 subunit epsilon
MFRRWRHRRRSRALSQQCRQQSLARYMAECAEIDVDKLVNTPLISVDLELTGLDARKNQIISIGWTCVDRGRVSFASNRHVMINVDQSVGHTAAIHELLDSDLAQGVSLEDGIQFLFEAACGRVWLFHHASLDVAFLQKACVSWAGVAPPFTVLDTMHMELAMRKRRGLPVHNGDLRLDKLRSSYNLPRYTAHNALVDACATAELLLAIAARMDSSESIELRPHLRYF